MMQLLKERPLDMREIKHLFPQLVSAIKYLHERDVAHRDVKLENLIVDEGHLTLIDFGYSV